MNERQQQIANRVAFIKDRIAEAAVKSQRDPNEIRLVAVSKTWPASDVLAAYKCGLREFGENRVQEGWAKAAQLPEDILWHQVGQLQRNKARKAVDYASLIHSLDRISLGETLNRLGREKGRAVEVLVEINIGGEASKAGIEPGELEPFLYQLKDLKWLKVTGLMTVAPYVDDTEKVRPCFAKLRELFEDAKSYGLPNVKMQVLSMGMTNDYETAITEGSTLVRVGRGIFGART